MKEQNIVVCGGGIAGMAAALGLARKAFKVQVLAPDASREPPMTDSYHPRVYAISAASQQFLDELGVWGLMQQQRLTPVTAMELYGDGGGLLELDAWQDARHTLTWIVESGEIERVLRQALKVYGVPWHDDHVDRLEKNVVISQKGLRLPADLVVGADGANSRVRAQAGISHQRKAYNDSAMVTHLTAELPHQGVAMQWFTGDSILALLPLPDTVEGPQVSMVWAGSENWVQEMMSLSPVERSDHLAKQLHSVTEGRLGKLTVRSEVYAFPLSLEKTGMVCAGVALVSDAAHRVHPLAGQGLNLGLGDVDELIRVLAAKPKQTSVGELRLLEQYRRARAEPIASMSLVTDGLHRLFAVKATPVVWLRNTGMSVFNKIPFLKRQLIANAAGVRPYHRD